MHKDSDLVILHNIQQILDKNPRATQRDIAREINISLGMTNSIVRRFMKKGWMLVHKLSPRHIEYVLSSDGINELTHRTYRYVKNTVKLAASYKDVFIDYIKTAKESGNTRVLLAGQTDVQFIVEYACKKLEMPLFVCDTLEPKDCDAQTLVLCANINDYKSVSPQYNAAHVFEVLATE